MTPSGATVATSNRWEQFRSHQFPLLAVFALLLQAPIYILAAPAPLRADLDSSWEAVLSFHFLARSQAGVDWVFTYGRWGFLAYPRGFDAVLPWLIAGRCILGAALALGLASVAVLLPPKLWLRCLWLAAVVILANPILIVPFLLFFTEAVAEEHIMKWVRPALLIATGLAAHVKFLALPLMLLGLTALFVRMRRRPMALLGNLAIGLGSWLCFYLAAGQNLTSLPSYLRGAIEVMSAHQEAMTTLPSFAIAGTGIGICFLTLALFRMSSGKSSRTSIGDALIFAVFLLIALKQAVLRYDVQHLQTGLAEFLGPLILCSAAVSWTRVYSLESRRQFGFLCGGIAAGIVLMYSSVKPLPAGLELPRSNWTALRGTLRGSLLRPLENRAERARLQREHPIVRLEGSVDVIPAGQAVVFANGLEYRPRPVFQSYLAATPYLIGLNHQFIASSHTADHLLVQVAPIDGRYPAIEDSLFWRDLMSFYDCNGVRDAYILCDRRSIPREVEGTLIQRSAVRFGEEVTIPRGAAYIWAQIELHTTWLGRLCGLITGTPVVRLGVSSGAAQAGFRFLPGAGRSGFLLSPLLLRTRDVLSLARGDKGFLADRSLRSFWLYGGSEAHWYFEPTISVRLYELKFSALPR